MGGSFMKFRVFAHSLFFGVYPVLFLFSANMGQVAFPWEITLLLLGITLIGSIILRALFRDDLKASLVVSLIIILFFSYGHVFDVSRAFLGGYTIAGIEILRHRYFLSFYLLLFVAGAYGILNTKKDLGDSIEFLNIMSFALLTIIVFKIGMFHVEATRIARLSPDPQGSEEIQIPSSDREPTEDLPNIYYIILDGRASSTVLDEYYNYSDTAFTGFLEKLGFYIARKSKANYSHTFLSLTSSLNMQYINYFAELLGKHSNIESLPNWLLRHNKVTEVLQSRGYKFVNIASGWPPTNRNPRADLNLGLEGQIHSFYEVFVQTTALRPFVVRYLGEKTRQRIRYGFKMLSNIPNELSPVFVLAHFMAPHPPFLFKRNGESNPQPKIELVGMAWKRKHEYIDQLIFIDNKVTQAVKKILEDSKRPTVIIIQSDHGPASVRTVIEEQTNSSLNERMPIFNAYYLPGVESNNLYESITAGFAVSNRPSLEVLWGGMVLICWLIGLTYIAKQENLNHVANLWPLGFLAIPFFYCFPYALEDKLTAVVWLGLFVLVVCAFYLVRRREPGNVGLAVVTLIAGISLLDALFLLKWSDQASGLLAIAAFSLTLVLQRVVPGT